MSTVALQLASLLGRALGLDREPPEGSDEALVRAGKQGDHACFARLVERYQDRAYTLARRLTGDPEEARDLAQEAFLRAYRALDRFQEGRPFYPWLVTILRNLVRNRARRRPPMPVAVGPEGADPVASAPGPEDLVGARMDRARLEAEVARLPLRYREVVVLRYLRDRSVKQVASLLGLPEGTVKTYLFRAREILRRRLAPERSTP